MKHSFARAGQTISPSEIALPISRPEVVLSAVNFDHDSRLDVLEVNPRYETPVIADNALTHGNWKSAVADQLNEPHLKCAIGGRRTGLSGTKDALKHSCSSAATCLD